MADADLVDALIEAAKRVAEWESAECKLTPAQAEASDKSDAELRSLRAETIGRMSPGVR